MNVVHYDVLLKIYGAYCHEFMQCVMPLLWAPYLGYQMKTTKGIL